MSLSWFDDSIHAQDLTIERRTSGAPDADGIATETVEEIPLEGYAVQPAGSDESVGDEKVITSRWRVSGPVTDRVRDQDTVLWRGARYQVDGSPQTYCGGTLDHTEFFLQTVKG